MKMGKKKEIKKKEKEEENYMVKNGSILLEELMSSGNGKCNPIRFFSAKQLQTATSNFQQSCCNEFFDDCSWFRAVLDDRSVLIKINGSHITAEMACRDVAISSQMSRHSRVLKLLGCCLELPAPALVYEDAENGQLNRIGGIGYGPNNYESPTPSSLSWRMRVRIGKDIAHALTYLHTAFSRPIIHLNVQITNVFLDKDWVPKLSDFSHSISIPEGETRVESDLLMATLECIDPLYLHTSFATEKTDVFSIGVFLLDLLIGDSHYKPPLFVIQQKSWDKIVDFKILEEGRQMDEEQQLRFHSELQAFLNLALKCVHFEEEQGH